ncbi:MAG: type II toxin-antitoxin system Phd/YefM family antitoxin [Anaerolineae bacterium]|nr:type II toxin-antitoxin system Phd/YefM family antitoxin [Anaerolineae bacterium]
MIVYTYSEARQKLATLLEQAVKEGEVKIRRKDGQTFVIRPEARTESPLDVEGIDLGITADEIVEFIREGRRTVYTTEPPTDLDSA